MSDDLVKCLRARANGSMHWVTVERMATEAADRIEQLEAVLKDDAKWLAAYHQWCKMNGCAPSSSDLINVRKALEGKDD